jgi:hypothetical protein
MVFVDGGHDEELQRAEIYGLLARLWFAPPDEPLLGQFAVAVTAAPEPHVLRQPRLPKNMRRCSSARARPMCCRMHRSTSPAH